jgi:hypothetical protein
MSLCFTKSAQQREDGWILKSHRIATQSGRILSYSLLGREKEEESVSVKGLFIEVTVAI